MTLAIILLVLTYIFNIIDYFQTIYAVQLLGIGVELNPIGRYMLANDFAWVFKIIITPIILAAIGFIVKLDKKQIWAVYFLFVSFLMLVIHNFIMLARAGIF